MKKFVFLLAFVLCGLLVAVVPKTSAATYGGYFGSTISDDHYWCNVFGDPIDGSQACNYNPPYGNQQDALTWMRSLPDQSSDSLKANIINYIRDRLNGGGLQQVGASFVIETSIGRNDNRTLSSSSAEFNDWVNRVNNPAVSLSLEGYGYSVNTAYDPNTNDVLYYGDGGSADSLVFRVNGSITYAIKLDCGNPLGQFSLPPYTPNQLPIGGFDALSCSGAYGWALDPNNSSDSILFKVYVNGVYTNTGVANVPRSDVGNHGWASGVTDQGPAFNPRTSNTFQVNAVDAQTGQEVSLGSKTVGPCVTATCVSSTFPATMEVNAPQSFVVKVDLSTDWASPPYNVGADPSKNNPALYVAVFDPNGNAIVSQYVGYNAGTQVAGPHLTSDAIPFTPTMWGMYTVRWQIVGGGITNYDTYSSTNNALTCGYGTPAPNNVAVNFGNSGDKPYFNVLGGDISAGPGFGTSCTNNATAGVKSWNTDTTGYYGAGTQLAGFVLGNMSSFAAAQQQIGSGAVQPSGLAFANTTAAPPKYGGGFGTLPCASDFYTDAIAPSNNPVTRTDTTLSAGTLGTGTYKINGDLTLTGTTLGQDSNNNGRDVTLAVKGNVYINGDILYGPYASLTQIPQFKLIVQGNIYINNLVSELHGAYIAEPTTPTSTTTGGLYTCSYGNGTSTTDFVGCSAKKLTFYGAVAAKTLKLLRASGTLSGSAPTSSQTSQTVSGIVSSAWQLNGTSTFVGGNSLYLTKAGTSNVAGSAFYKTPLGTDQMDITFSSTIGGGTGADGLALYLLPTANPTTSLGGVGCGLGYRGIGSGVAVSLDTWQSTGDPSYNFVGVGGPAGTDCAVYSTTANLGSLNLRSGSHTVHVVVNSGKLTVSIDGTAYITNFAVTLPPQVYVGFTGANGGNTDNHYVTTGSFAATGTTIATTAPANVAAETFQYTPEFWLSDLNPGTDSRFDSLTSLSPVL